MGGYDASGKRLARCAVLMAVLAVAACAAPVRPRPDEGTLSLIPMPASLQRQRGHFILRQGGLLVVDSANVEAAGIARRFADRLQATRGIRLDERASGGRAPRGAIAFVLDGDAGRVPAGEGYELDVDEGGIRVIARDARGLFHGSVTLWQLLTQQMTAVDSIDVPGLTIRDQPRFAWRGAMLDSARHFQPPDFIKHFIDQLALAKLNTFHWHLTDDQGWRIEIKRYPRLTDVGAWRRPAGAAGTDAQGRPVRYGGYYTQDEIRDIVRYAAERYVTIVPEIDMPGHMQAAIAAYPALGSAGDVPVVSPDWGVHRYLLNADEKTLVFMQNVLDEVVTLFPGPYVHVGGDEAVKDQWQASAQLAGRMRELGIADPQKLQGWFIARLQRHLSARGRRTIGWDEILEEGLPADTTVMSWRGAKGGIEAARAGHDVVMSPGPDLYLDHLQGTAVDEPPGRPDLRTLADIYAFEPLPAELDSQEASHVLGAQANLWTEHMRTTQRVEHAAFPRLAALAEVLWTPPAAHDWNGFVARLVPQMARYHALGVDAADSVFDVRVDAADTFAAGGDAVEVTLSNQAGLPIRYTLDGSAPRASSPLYVSALRTDTSAVLQAATWMGSRRVGRIVRVGASALVWQRASGELRQCSGALTLRLEDDAPAQGARAIASVDLFDPCWVWPQAPLERIERVDVRVGQMPYNFQLSQDVVNIVARPAPQTDDGELLVKRDSCDGEVLARLPLADAARETATSMLSFAMPPTRGAHDLCFLFSGRSTDPIWFVDSVRLQPRVH